MVVPHCGNAVKLSYAKICKMPGHPLASRILPNWQKSAMRLTKNVTVKGFQGRQAALRWDRMAALEGEGRRMKNVKLTVSVVILLLLGPAAHAVIKALTPLRAFLADSQFVVIAKVEKLLPDRPGIILAVAEDLK